MEEHGYYLHNIRALLINGFDERGLRNLCFDVPDLRPVHDRISRGYGKEQIVAELVEYGDTHLLLDRLLALARERSPARYAKHGPYYVGDPTPILQRNITDLSRRLMIVMSSLCAFYSIPRVNALMNLLGRIEDLLYNISEMRAYDDTSLGTYDLPKLLSFQSKLRFSVARLFKDHACALLCLSSLDHVREWEKALGKICTKTNKFDIEGNGAGCEDYRELLAALDQVRDWKDATETKRHSVSSVLMQVEDWLSDAQDQNKPHARARSPNAELKAAQQQAGLSQAELAHRVGASRSTVGRWERSGVIPRSSVTRQAVAQVLDFLPWPGE